MKVFTFFKLFFIKCLRLYNLISPFIKGKIFVERMITSLAEAVNEDLEFIIKCKFGLKFLINISEPQFHQLLCYGIYEEAETDCFKRILHEGDIVLDIGANFGWYTILGAKIVGSAGQIHAFEPIPLNFNYLSYNKALSNQDEIIIINNFGLGDKIEDREFYLFDNAAIGDASALIANRKVKRKFICKMNLLDNYLKEKNIEKVNIIKCDVEGFEFKVLNGAKNLLTSEKPPIILIEINERLSNAAGYEGIEILRFLYEISSGQYSFYRIDQNTRRVHAYNLNIPLNPIENLLCIIKDIHGRRLNTIL